MTKHDEAVQVAARERLFDAELAEVLDVPVAAVSEPQVRAQGAAWLAAALVLLGVFVAAGVAWLRCVEDASTAQEPGGFDPVFPWYERFPSLTIATGAAVLASLPPVTSLGMRLEDDRNLAFLERQCDLRHLMVLTSDRVECALSREALRAIAALPNLESLEFTDKVQATADDLRELRVAPKLDALSLCGSPIRLDAKLGAVLVELPKLRLLQTWDAEVTIEGLETLAGMPHLEALILGRMRIDDATVAALAKLRTLRVLGIFGDVPRYGSKPMARLSASHVRALAKLPRLVSLSLEHCTVDDEALASLPLTLQSFCLGAVDGVTAAGLQSVAKLPRLRALSLAESGSDPLILAAAVHLVRALKLERFESPNAVLPADLWAAFADQPLLRHLQLRCPDAGAPNLSPCTTMPALEQLKLFMPKSLVPADLAPLKELPKFRSLVVIGLAGLPADQREALVDCLGPGVTVLLQ